MARNNGKHNFIQHLFSFHRRDIAEISIFFKKTIYAGILYTLALFI